MKEKFVNKQQVAKLMGKSHTMLDKNGFFSQLKNYSPSERFAMYEESEVLSKKEGFLDEAKLRRAKASSENLTKVKGGKRGKKAASMSRMKAENGKIHELILELDRCRKEQGRILRKIAKELN